MFAVDIANAGVRLAAPIALAGLGETVSERAGVLNVQLEGMMLVGAFTGVVAARATDSPLCGLLSGVTGGVLLATMHALLCLTLGGDQVVSGIGLNLFALGGTSYLVDAFFDGRQIVVDGFASFRLPLLADIPIVGPVFFDQNLGVYLTYLLLAVLTVALYRTKWGLRVLAVGEAPIAADRFGVPVYRTRYVAVLIAGAMAGLAGAVVSLCDVRLFTDNMIQGRGFIALAAVAFGNWRVTTVAACALLFGTVRALELRLQAVSLGVPPQLLYMLPYVLTLAFLAGFMGRARPPGALGQVFDPR